MTSKIIHLKRFSVCIVIPLAACCLTVLFAGDIKTGYESMLLPPFSPPPWIFPGVWITLAVLMGVAAYLITESRDKRNRIALKLYYAHVALHILWAAALLRFHLYIPAVIILLMMWAALLAATVLFHTLDRFAGHLILPCLVYITYMGYVNMAAAVIN